MIPYKGFILQQSYMTSLTIWIEAARFHRPIGSWLLAVPMLLALRLAPLSPSFTIYLLVLCVTARSFGCIVNDYADRDIDRHVQRTKNRPFARKEISPINLLIMLGPLSLLCTSCFFILPSQAAPACLAAPFWIVLYASSKRWCPAPQIILAIAFSWSIVIISKISFQDIPLNMYLLFGTNMFWVSGFDTTYALSDYPDDRKLPIYSLPKTLGLAWSPYFSAISLICAHLGICVLFPKSPLVLISSMSTLWLIIETLQNRKSALSLFSYHGFIGLAWVMQAWSQ